MADKKKVILDGNVFILAVYGKLFDIKRENMPVKCVCTKENDHFRCICTNMSKNNNKGYLIDGIVLQRICSTMNNKCTWHGDSNVEINFSPQFIQHAAVARGLVENYCGKEYKCAVTPDIGLVVETGNNKQQIYDLINIVVHNVKVKSNSEYNNAVNSLMQNIEGILIDDAYEKLAKANNINLNISELENGIKSLGFSTISANKFGVESVIKTIINDKYQYEYNITKDFFRVRNLTTDTIIFDSSKPEEFIKDKKYLGGTKEFANKVKNYIIEAAVGTQDLEEIGKRYSRGVTLIKGDLYSPIIDVYLRGIEKAYVATYDYDLDTITFRGEAAEDVILEGPKKIKEELMAKA